MRFYSTENSEEPNFLAAKLLINGKTIRKLGDCTVSHNAGGRGVGGVAGIMGRAGEMERSLVWWSNSQQAKPLTPSKGINQFRK
jgi:hypothetical protein